MEFPGASSLERWLTDGSAPSISGQVSLGSELARALVLATLSRRSSQPILAVFATKIEARNAMDNLAFFLGRSERIHYLPPIDFDFYRGVFPSAEVTMDRNASLSRALEDPQGRIFVITLAAVLQRVMPPSSFKNATQLLQPNMELIRDKWLLRLSEAGYQRQPTVYDPGIFSVRGNVVDIYSPTYDNPLRFEFYGDLIEQIRFFDPSTQRSLEPIDKVSIIPVGQTLLPSPTRMREVLLKIKERLDNLGLPKATRDEYLEKIDQGVTYGNIGFLFPILSGGSSSIFEYFSPESLFVWAGRAKLLDSARDIELPRLQAHHSLFERDLIPVATIEELFIGIEDLENAFDRPNKLCFETFESVSTSPQFSLSVDKIHLQRERQTVIQKNPGKPLLDPFARKFKSWIDEGYRIQIVCHTQTHAQRSQLLFEPYGLKFKWNEEVEAFPRMLQSDGLALNFWQGFITESAIFPLLRLVILSEEEIFGHKKRVIKTSAWNSGSGTDRILSSFRDLKLGDYVVHKDFGIGRYLALKSMNFLGVPNDYVLLEYRDGDKLYIPIYRLNILQKFAGGEGANPTVDKLGADHWAKVKQKAEKAISELAAELLNLQARRRLTPADPCIEPADDFHQFEMDFPFDETPDQTRAIDETTHDLRQSHPMDRLLVGDVGYGKTEVAMRAALLAVLSNKQVAILVPTTVLAFQHYETFKARFQNFPIRVEMVSRLRAPSEIKSTITDTREGRVDILIGTHRLLSPDVSFKSLGLIVVDEEHRFGVAHKEKLKKLSASVHVLSMTATPIPRTLNMAMTGIKDISLINTPPPDRLSVRTFVCHASEEVIQEAISQELTREGQVFFVHNRIETIGKKYEELRELFPKIKIEVVHGQMESEQLEKRMLAFYQGEFQVLLTTAIIESGLDIPRANTIIIDQADRFGLAQLYQLRGRVGRSEKRAYCYLLVPPENMMTPDARQRLQIIQRYHDLGSGFNIASHDLELRGAGDMLGKEQSGYLNSIGVDLYFDLLEESVRILRGEAKKHDIEPEINLRLAAYFPQEYLPEISERISLYRRLSSVEDETKISEIEGEIRDRFGPPPIEVVNLIGLMDIKLYLKRLHVIRMSCGPKKTSLQFAPTTPANPEKLVKLIRSNPGRYSLTPEGKLLFSVEDTDWRSLLKEVQNLSIQLVDKGLVMDNSP